MTGAVAAVERVVADGGEADDILRSVVETLVEQGAARWAGIFFAESGELELGPQSGEPAPEVRTQVPVVYRGTAVAELAADGADPALLGQVAPLIAELCLVGWDTGGATWE
jgi:hypothetical protein